MKTTKSFAQIETTISSKWIRFVCFSTYRW